MSGWIYVISKEFIGGLVKVGVTKREVIIRIKDFEKSSAAPGQYAVEYAVNVSDCEALERRVHIKLEDLAAEYNRRIHREWFAVDAHIAARAIEDTINDMSGIVRYKSTGNVFKPDGEGYEYICCKCRVRLTENTIALNLSDGFDLRKHWFNNDYCKDCMPNTEVVDV